MFRWLNAGFFLLINIFHCYSIFTFDLGRSEFFLICISGEIKERPKDATQTLHSEYYSVYINLVHGFKFEVSILLEKDSQDFIYSCLCNQTFNLLPKLLFLIFRRVGISGQLSHPRRWECKTLPER